MNKEKSDRPKSTPQVLAMYNSGELRAPCVRLQCLKFDTAFYRKLVNANDQFFSNKPRPGPPPNGTKRRKLKDDQSRNSEIKDEDEDKTEEYASAEPSNAGRGPSESSNADPSEPRLLSESPLTTIGETPSRGISAVVQAARITSTTPAPGTTAGFSASTPAQFTRSTLRRQDSGPLVLRIPGGRSTQSPIAPLDVRIEEAQVEMELSQ